MLLMLDNSMQRDLGFYNLKASARLIGRLEPSAIEVQPAMPPKNQSFLLWDPVKRQPAPKRRRTGWRFDFAAFVDAGGEEGAPARHEPEDELYDELAVDETGEDGQLHVVDATGAGDEYLEVALEELIGEQQPPQQPDAESNGAGASGDEEGDLAEIFGEKADEEPIVAIGSQAGGSDGVAPAMAGNVVIEAGLAGSTARGKATTEVVIGAHNLAYYANKQEFHAYCKHPAHGKQCCKVKTSRGHPSPTQAARGRPCGFLLAWLMLGDTKDIRSSDEDKWVSWPTLQERREARRLLMESEVA